MEDHLGIRRVATCTKTVGKSVCMIEVIGELTYNKITFLRVSNWTIYNNVIITIGFDYL